MAGRLRGRPLAAVVPIGIGHNNGPPMATRWGTHCWRRAQARAWKPPGPEVVRLRLRRAAELGLDYRQLAAILMETGRAPTAIVFALEALLAPGAAERLRGLDRPRLLAVAVDRDGAAAARAGQVGADGGRRLDGWRVVADRRELPDAVTALLDAQGVPPAAALLVGVSDADREVVVRARLAAYLDAAAYFDRPLQTQPHPTKGPMP